jgi:hypothetical protein
VLLGERLFEQPDEMERVDEHVGYEAEHDRRFRRSFRLQEEHHQYDREHQRPHQNMDGRDELNLLNVIDSEHVPPERILRRAQADDEIRSHSHVLETSEDRRQPVDFLQNRPDVLVLVGMAQS